MTTTAPAAAMTRGLHPLPPGWTEHTAPTGHKYYYNASLKKSTYQRPMIEATQTPPTPPIAQQPLSTQPTSASRIEQVVPLTEWSAEVRPQQDDQPEEKQTGRVQGQDMWALLEDRPRKKIEIPGAEPWVQVTTKWRRFFYHNPETNESYWKVPPSIRQAAERMQIDTARADIVGSESESESDWEDPDAVDPADIPEEFTEEDIAYQLSLMQSEYPADEIVEEEELDNTAKRQIFISLLEDKEVNPFNTWENEMPKIVHDPRYAMVQNTKQRIDIFTEWARARLVLIKEEKAQEQKEDPKIGYLRFLADKADTKEYWFEFRRKHRKALEYKHYGSEKLREDLWRDWCARKKTSREKKEADLLSWMRGLKGTKEEILERVHGDVRYWVLGDEKDSIVMDALRGR